MSTAQTAMDVIKRAHEQREAEDLLALMTGDTEMVEYTMTDISAPRHLVGKDEIAVVLRDVMSRDMVHEVSGIVASDERIAYTVHCTYPDGNRVLGSYTADLDDDGTIRRLTGHVSWTE